MALSKSFQSGQIALSCQMCEESSEIKWKCLTCPFFMCSKCCKIHRKVKSSDKHDIVDIKDTAIQATESETTPDSTNINCKDAPEEGMKICPVCSATFSADISDSKFEEHVLGHVGRICPLCQGLLENCNDEDFQRHFNQHLDHPSFQPTDPMEFD